MRDVDRGRRHPLVQLLHLRAHLHPQLGVEIGQRLVEQEYLRIAHDRAAHGDALALSARQLPRPARKVALDVEDSRSVLDSLADFVLRPFAIEQPERHVVVDCHVRVERVILEDHRDVAVLGLQIVDDTAVDCDRTGGDVLESGDHSQQGRLPAARRTNEHEEFLVKDLEAQRMQDLDGAERLGDFSERNGRHLVLSRVSTA